jgi:phospholipase C
MCNVKRWQLFGASSLILMAVTLAALIVPLAPTAYAKSAPAKSSSIMNFDHVFIIMMENTGYDTLIGNPNAPLINFFANRQGLAKNYFGITHPSQPNYIGATSGSLNGVTTDNDTTIDVPNIVDQLEANGKTWKGYMQSLSLCDGNVLAHACGNQLYERKHDPFVSYADVQSNPARLANIVDFSRFATDLANNTVPNYSWISPDQCHDMHGRSGPSTDPCNFNNITGLIRTGDNFVGSTVAEIEHSRAWTNNSVIFITWDESDFTNSGFQGFGDDSGCCDSPPGQGGGHVVMLTILRQRLTAQTSNVAYNHYSMLATIEDSWNLGCLGFTCDTENVQPMTDLVTPQGKLNNLPTSIPK